MTDAITCQVSEQVRRAMEVANSVTSPLRLPTGLRMRALPPAEGDTVSPLHGAGARSVAIRLKWSSLYGAARSTRSHGIHRLLPVGGNCQINNCFHSLYNTFQVKRLVLGVRTDFQASGRGDTPYSEDRPMTMAPKPQNARNYCKFHKQSGHTTNERREPKKALHELADKDLPIPKEGTAVLSTGAGACSTPTA
ncbi:LOW QUALITY PROTEIN: hypothetical protein Cgig2_015292 [Carnegiea gigantea]|uniref:Uncharacterized protein n=1 Tax=Carnegiea gigantea TaxID=171969 RepID=A0A9Q1GKU6_9CARY|nr:LOW QUALITY PROTEIN: hypothetical protein Cgig2_015292 [Carnegiea gigantea]